MAFRDDLSAAHARADALQQRVDQLESENAALRADPEESLTEPSPRNVAMMVSITLAAALVVAVAFVVWVLGQPAIGAVVFAAGAVFVIMIAMVSSVAEVVPAGFVLVLSGRTRVTPDGQRVGYRVVAAGRTMRIPIVERVDRIDVRPHSIEFAVSSAYSKGNVPLSIAATGLIKIASREPALDNAIERFLGRSLDDVHRVARETLEGCLRTLVADLTLEELRTDRDKVAAHLMAESESDLRKLGLEVDSLQIQSVDAAR